MDIGPRRRRNILQHQERRVTRVFVEWSLPAEHVILARHYGGLKAVRVDGINALSAKLRDLVTAEELAQIIDLLQVPPPILNIDAKVFAAISGSVRGGALSKWKSKY